MELEIALLDRRYESLRTRSATRERRLLSSLDAAGQQTPIVVVRDGDRDVVVDGYKRVRALSRLGHDLVRATSWDLSELDAWVLERILRSGEHGSAIEEGWFLQELQTRFGLSREELARRFDRTPSWVSRRLSLVRELPMSVQEHVRSGAISAHGAERYLVPLARANEVGCEKVADAIAPKRPSTRQLAQLWSTYVSGNESTRALVVESPHLVLKARAEADREGDARKTPVAHLLDDLRILGAVARRASGRLRRGALDDAHDEERERVRVACTEASSELTTLGTRCEQELARAR
ncbi:MAG TPA: ParB N-terminal domain-containing protein [Sandaracinaceae bacterium LLY-WYZ-13_1]|nr:ParB N-terminal domain-containing protein [Sandaracinaceae bacterium LLY-WYZ-13_1]